MTYMIIRKKRTIAKRLDTMSRRFGRCLEWCFVVELPALGVPLVALGAVTVAALAGPFDLGRGPLEAGADLVGLDLGDRPLVALGGLPAALAEPPGDHDPVALGQGVGQVLGLPTPDVDLEEAGVAVAPLAVLLDALGDRPGPRQSAGMSGFELVMRCLVPSV